MKLDNLAITIYVDETGARIEVRDNDAAVRFLDIKMTAAQFTAALGRQGHVECVGEVYGLDRVGMRREQQDFTFKVLSTDKGVYGDDRRDLARRAALVGCPVGWEPQLYFGQDSFFFKGKELWARTKRYRWVPLDAESNGT